MKAKQALLKLIYSEFTQYRSADSLILSLNTAYLMLMIKNEEQQHHIRLIDGSFNSALVNLGASSGDYQQVLILRALNASIPHYFTLWVERKAGISQCILLDASNCHEHFSAILEKLHPHFNNVLVAIGDEKLHKIQRDTKSCFLFAFEHARLLASCDTPWAEFSDIQHILNSTSVLNDWVNDKKIDEKQAQDIKKSDIFSSSSHLSIMRWVDMPFEYVKHMQTVSGIDYYIQHNTSDAVAMTFHKANFVRLKTSLMVVPSNCSLIDWTLEIQDKLEGFINETNEDVLFETMHVLPDIERLLEMLADLIENISIKQCIEIYRFIFSENPLSKKEIDRLIHKIACIQFNERILDLIKADRLNFLNLISHPKFNILIASNALLTLLENGKIASNDLGYIRSQRQLLELDSSELFTAIQDSKLAFSTYAKAKDFNLAAYLGKSLPKSPKSIADVSEQEHNEYIGLQGFV